MAITFTLFRDWVPSLAPSWLRRKWGRRFHEALGLLLDGFTEAATQALRARLIAFAPVDALQYIGEERGIFRFPTEDPGSYRARLLAAWDQWELAGTPEGIVAGLAAAGYTAIVHEARKPTETRADTWNRGSGSWARFWVELPAGGHDFGTTSWRIGDGTLVGPETVVGFDGLASVVIPKLDLIRRIIRKWKGSHARCVQIVIVLSGAIVGEFIVGDGTLVGGEIRYVSPGIAA